MTSVLKVLLADPTTYQTLFTAVATASYACYRANELLFKSPSSQSHTSLPAALIDDNSRVLEGSLALAFPLIASFSILLLFFFLTSIGAILTTLSAISGFFSLVFLFWPICEQFSRRVSKVPGLHTVSLPLLDAILSSIISAGVILFWLFTGYWLANNVIGVALCVLFASLCKVPSLKVTVWLFVGLFAYDIFFVFFSERVFGRNVMVEVATSTPTNPASAIAKFLHLPFSPIPNLALPAKLIFPSGDNHQTILGLGDIILPEVLLVFLLDFDLRNRHARPLWKGYFALGILCYGLGLFSSFFFSYAFNAAQPALLYIVPLTLIPTAILGKRRSDLARMWKGNVFPPRAEEQEETERRETQGEGRRGGEEEALLA